MLAAEGATVLVHGLEPGQADATVATIEAPHGRVHAVTGDLRTEPGTAALVAEVHDAVDRVDIVINNYGLPDGSDWESSDTKSWHGSYDTNVVSAVRVTQAFLPGMRAAGWGRVVFVATVGATRPGDRIPEYYAAKGALPSVAVGLAKHLAGTGITVNCVSPGIIATAGGRRALHGAGAPRRARDRLGECRAPDPRHRDVEPVGARATPEDVGRFVAFVVGEPGWHLNGAHLRFDGGAADTVT